MFGYYPQRHSYPYFTNDDYLHALAAQQAREREEARYRAQLAEAARRRVYQEQLARARAQAEAQERRRRSMYNPFFGGYDDDYHPYSSYVQPQPPSYYYGEEDPEEDHYNSYEDPARGRQAFLESLMRQKMAENEREQKARMNTRTMSRSPKRPGSPVPETSEPPHQQRQKTPSPQLSPRMRPTPSPKSTPSPMPPSPSPALSSSTKIRISDPGEERAARKIQSFVRTHLPRHMTLKSIFSIATEFDSTIASFTFPETLEFDKSAQDVKLLYTQRNGPLLGHEEACLKLLSKLDAVESHGDEGIRAERKKLVKRIENHLAELDERKNVMWEMTKPKEESQMSTEMDVEATQEPSAEHEMEVAPERSAEPEQATLEPSKIEQKSTEGTPMAVDEPQTTVSFEVPIEGPYPEPNTVDVELFQTPEARPEDASISLLPYVPSGMTRGKTDDAPEWTATEPDQPSTSVSDTSSNGNIASAAQPSQPETSEEDAVEKELANTMPVDSQESNSSEYITVEKSDAGINSALCV